MPCRMDMRWSSSGGSRTLVPMRSTPTSVLVLVLVTVSACSGLVPDAAPSSDAGVSSGSPIVDGIARACLMNNACGFQSDLGLPADKCVDRLTQELVDGYVQRSPEGTSRNAQMIECARTSTSCDDYVRCVRFGGTCSGTVAGSCQGTIADRCSTPGGNTLPPIFDCARLGMTCEKTRETTCVLPATAPACSGAVGSSTCDGNTRVHCRARAGGGAAALREDCPSGSTCIAVGTSTGCAPSVGTCAAESARCEGDVLMACAKLDGQLRELRTDCAKSGRRCLADAKGVGACVPRAEECTRPARGESSARCNGNALEVCIEGRLARVDCASVGRSECKAVPAIPGAQAATVACF